MKSNTNHKRWPSQVQPHVRARPIKMSRICCSNKMPNWRRAHHVSSKMPTRIRAAIVSTAAAALQTASIWRIMSHIRSTKRPVNIGINSQKPITRIQSCRSIVERSNPVSLPCRICRAAVWSIINHESLIWFAAIRLKSHSSVADMRHWLRYANAMRLIATTIHKMRPTFRSVWMAVANIQPIHGRSSDAWLPWSQRSSHRSTIARPAYFGAKNRHRPFTTHDMLSRRKVSYLHVFCLFRDFQQNKISINLHLVSITT